MAHLPDHELIVFGSGPAEDALRAAAGAAGVEQRVRILGRITDDELRHWYRGADVFVTLSREEAFGLTVLEAVSAGAAVVASDIPAHREQAHELPADWLRLVSVDAAPGEIAAAILASGRRRDRLAPPRLRGWGEVVSATLDVYRAVLAQRGRMVPATARDDEPA
jgi:glycosyltransferase involved in cell wall biosynthesis